MESGNNAATRAVTDRLGRRVCVNSITRKSSVWTQTRRDTAAARAVRSNFRRMVYAEGIMEKFDRSALLEPNSFASS